MGDAIEIDERTNENDGRHQETEEQEGDERSLTAETRSPELFLRARGFQQFLELQIVERLFHEPHRRRTKLALASSLCECLTLLLAQFVAPFVHRLHAACERVGL